jgi:hypothetical protein
MVRIVQWPILAMLSEANNPAFSTIGELYGRLVKVDWGINWLL